MDRHRGDRFGDGGGRHSRMSSRWSDGPSFDQHHSHPNGRGGGGDGFSGGRHNHHRGGPYDHPSGIAQGGRRPGFRPGPGGPNAFDDQPMPMGGARRGGFGGSGRGGGSPNKDNFDGTKFVKLFVGAVPPTATEQDIRPLFEQHGHVIEVALIKDKRTGQQQGCCFVKYPSCEEAERAIKALHNQVTLPRGMGPIHVRYADGERERLGATEHKLFVGSLSRHATEKDIEELFAPYGHIEDVYLLRDDMKQNRGCGFVKFSSREMAAAAINGLNGVFTMRGAEQPLIVRFADPKRPKPGESRGGPTFGGPGFGSRSQFLSTDRSSSNPAEPIGGRQPPNMWHSNPEQFAPPPQNNTHNFGSQLHSNGGYPATFPSPGFGPPGNIETTGQPISSLEKLLPPAQHLPPTLQFQQNQQNSAPFSQIQGLQGQFQGSQMQTSHPGNFPSFSQPLSSHHLLNLGALPSSQPQGHQNAAGTLQIPPNFQQGITGVNPQQLTGSAIPQLLQLAVNQVPAQVLQQQQQAQALQSNLQGPQLAYAELQHQLSAGQPSHSGQQQNAMTGKQQSVSTVAVPTASASSVQLNGQAVDIPTSLTCSWSEHTSPDGFKYYYNSITKESRWEKPEELTIFEQQQQQQKLLAQQLQSQSQLQAHLHIPSVQQISQLQQAQIPVQPRQQVQLQPSMYQASGVVSNQNVKELSYPSIHGLGSVMGPTHMPKGPLTVHDWSLSNKPAGM